MERVFSAQKHFLADHPVWFDGLLNTSVNKKRGEC